MCFLFGPHGQLAIVEAMWNGLEGQRGQLLLRKQSGKRGVSPAKGTKLKKNVSDRSLLSSHEIKMREEEYSVVKAVIIKLVLIYMVFFFFNCGIICIHIPLPVMYMHTGMHIYVPFLG